MSKLDSLIYLQNKGLNIHNYEVVRDRYHLGGICKSYKNCSIRFDREKGDLQLPFTLMEQLNGQDNWDITDILNIYNKAEELGCYLIVSDGRNYDPDMRYNICVKVEQKGEFICEMSPLKVPLRHMYKHPLMCVTGSLIEPKHWWDIWGEQTANMREVKEIVETVYSKGIIEKFVECTTYNKKVGILNEEMVFWHIWN